MANPRLRPLEVFPTDVDGKRLLCLRDPSGFTDHLAFLPPIAAALLALCDGRRSIAEIARDFAVESGHPVSEDDISHLFHQLDEGLFLDSPRFERHRQETIAAFRAAPTRPAANAGKSYPTDAHALEALLAGFLGAPSPCQLPIGLVAPHIDFARGGPVYGHAYRSLAGASTKPDLIIIFGTDHNGLHEPFTLTRKSYETPLGVVRTEADIADALGRVLPAARLHGDEFNHRSEHSIEFQAVWLRFVYGDQTPPVLPILCGPLPGIQSGSPGRDAYAQSFMSELARLTMGRRVLVIAAADLAHVGPRFGDKELGKDERATLEEFDRTLLAHVARGDADGFLSAIIQVGDRYRVCGLSPIHATLAFLNQSLSGRKVAYDQCPADDAGTSFVSIAAVVLESADALAA